jgi:hypothetical protein
VSGPETPEVGSGWGALNQAALDRMAAVRGWLDECLFGARTPTPGELSRCAGQLLYAAGALLDASALGSPPGPDEAPDANPTEDDHE